jgi:hypothetical protein
MIRRTLIPLAALLIVLTLVAGCVSRPATPLPDPTPASSDTGAVPAPTEASGTADSETTSQTEPSAADLARSDAQGAVEFVVTPLNLAAAGATLDFDVSMNTHSVDLGWDLAAQSVLVTDTGLEVTGQSWPIGSGHHYQGTLTFPSTTSGGEALLDGVTALTLTIRDTDVAARVFTWELGD